jgi:MoaE-MoaD fusion protein
MFQIVEESIDVAAVTAAVADPATGATVTFIGTTRDNNDGRQVTQLEYEAYPEMALAEMRKIGATAKERWPISKIAIVHRIGRVPIGEASVVIAVSSAHRNAAFEACHFAIDRLKEVVPIWKKEHFTGGEVWIGSQKGEEFPRGANAPRGNVPR